ncbi:MAG TPA: hypothetical protein VHS05_10925 [Pyrinomonadaceae bacterium]|nr:hypothetical protein [Pyrinomonadaceae bacterium]
MPRLNPLFSFLLLIVLAGPLHAQQRQVLYSNSPSPQMQALVNTLRDPHSAQIPLGQLRLPDRYFVRILERRFVLTAGNTLVDNAVLGGPSRPFAFLTTPEGFFGKPLVEMYGDIGYEAEQMIAQQRDKEMVVVLFRYPDNVNVSAERNGTLGGDWRDRIYPTTWANMLALFTRLVKDNRSPACKNAVIPAQNICLSPSDRAFVLTFPRAGKRQLEKKEYAALHAMGGPLWRYRKLLEDKLSMFEHFRGDGHTENEVEDFRNGQPGPRLYEVVGPNIRLAKLPELVVIDLGKMIIEDCFSPVCVR